MSSRAWNYLCLLAVALVTAAAFWPAVQADFLPWDDDFLIYRNPHLRGLSTESLRWMFFDYHYTWRYHPLTWVTWFGIHDLAGMRPAAYHAANYLAHVLNAALVFVLLRQWFRACGRGVQAVADEKYLGVCAALGALFWAMHSLRLETVGWVAAFVHAQGFFFMLLSLVAYLQAQVPETSAGRRRLWYWGSVVSLAASLLSFPVAAGMVGILLAMDFWPLGRIQLARGAWWTPELRRVLWQKVPFMAVTVVVLGMAISARVNYGAQDGAAPLPLGARLMQGCYIWVYYLWRPWLPLDAPTVSTELMGFRATDLPFLLSAVALAAISLVLWRRRAAWPMGLALWGVHLAALFPMCGWMENPHFASDRYGLMAGVVWSALLVAGMWQWRQAPPRRTAALVVVGAAVLAMATMVPLRLQVWNNPVAFFEDFRLKMDRAVITRSWICLRLGDAYRLADNYAKAEEAYRDALEGLPDSTSCHMWLGMVLGMQNKNQDAERHLKRAVALDPAFAPARQNLATLYRLTGRDAAAAEEYRELLRRAPDHAGAHQALGALLKKLGNTEEAEIHFAEARRLEAVRKGDAPGR